MIFENEQIEATILSISDLHQENVDRHNTGRSFDAISFRFSADTDLVTEKSTQHVSDNYVCFVPKNTSYDRIAAHDTLIAVNCIVHNYSADDIECFLPRKPGNLARLFYEIRNCWNKQEVGYMHTCTALLYQIFAECCVQSVTNTQSDSKIRNSVNYIHSNYTKSDLSIQKIAAESYMSEVYFRKLFREEFGTSPQKYIIGLRIQKAIELIRIGDYSLKEIAFMSGYSNYKYFSTEFKRSTGLSPSDYIKEFFAI